MRAKAIEEMLISVIVGEVAAVALAATWKADWGSYACLHYLMAIIVWYAIDKYKDIKHRKKQKRENNTEYKAA